MAEFKTAKIRYRKTNFRKEALNRIDVINEILAEYGSGDKLSARQVYYRLVAGLHIENTVRSYKNLTNLLTDARYAGLIDWDVIEDRGREPTIWAEYDSIRETVDRAMFGFRLPRWRNQPKYVELWVEKQALAGVLEPIAAESHVTLLVNKGYSSASAMKEAADRLIWRASYGADELDEEREVIVLYLGDHDPSGEDMVRDIRVRLEEFGVERLEVRKVALTLEQVEQFNLPPNPAKTIDSRSPGYIAEHGDSSWELDAIPPRDFTRIVRNALKAVTNQKLMNQVIAEEERQKLILGAVLKKIK